MLVETVMNALSMCVLILKSVYQKSHEFRNILSNEGKSQYSNASSIDKRLLRHNRGNTDLQKWVFSVEVRKGDYQLHV